MAIASVAPVAVVAPSRAELMELRRELAISEREAEVEVEGVGCWAWEKVIKRRRCMRDARVRRCILDWMFCLLIET